MRPPADRSVHTRPAPASAPIPTVLDCLVAALGTGKIGQELRGLQARLTLGRPEDRFAGVRGPGAGRTTPLDERELGLVLGAILEGADLAAGAMLVGRTHEALKALVEASPELEQLCAQAREVRAELLRKVALERAHAGKAGPLRTLLEGWGGMGKRAQRADAASKTEVELGTWVKIVEASSDPEVEAEARRQLDAGEPGEVMPAEPPAEAELQRKASITLARWRLDPVDFVVTELGEQPQPWQVKAFRLFPGACRLALKACKGPGKTWWLARAAWNFFGTRAESKVAVTSITEQNLEDGLWSELRAVWKRSAFLRANFVFQAERIYPRWSDPESWFISARKWKRGANPRELEETLAGLHAGSCMFLLDEVSGYPTAVVEAAEGVLATNGDCKVVKAGNALYAWGPLYDACTRYRASHEVVEVTGDPDDPDRSPNVSLKWARDYIAKYGRQSPWVQTNVLGVFPRNVTEGLVSIKDVMDAYGREADPGGTPLRRDRRTIGADIARRGKAASVFAFREGDYVVKLEEHHGLRTNETAGELKRAIAEWEPEVAFVDDSGIGGAVVDILLADGTFDQLVPLHPSEASQRPEYHLNRRSEMAESIQIRFQNGTISLAVEIGQEQADTSFEREITSLRYTFSATGKRKLEDKDQYIARVGISPDRYDAIALAFADDAVLEGAGAAGDEVPLPRGEISTSGIRVAAASVENDDEDTGEWGPHRHRVPMRLSA